MQNILRPLCRQFTDQPEYTFLLVCLIAAACTIIYLKNEYARTDHTKPTVETSMLPATLMKLQKLQNGENTEYRTFLMIENIYEDSVYSTANKAFYLYCKTQNLHPGDKITVEIRTENGDVDILKAGNFDFEHPEKTIKNIQNQTGDIHII